MAGYAEAALVHDDLEQHTIKAKAIFKNAYNLLHALPPSSPFHRSIVYYLGQGLSDTDVALAFDITKRSVQYAHEAARPLLAVQYALNTHCNCVGRANFTFLQQTIDELLPVRSGRSWQLQRQTNQQLYVQYCAQAAECGLVPLSYSFVTKRYLCSLSIHHDHHIKYCLHCHFVTMHSSSVSTQYDETKDEEWAFWHKRHAPQQEQAYFSDKQKLSKGQGRVFLSLLWFYFI